MSSFFSANQYEHVFWPHRLQNYEIPHRYKERPSMRPGFTRVLSNPIGHLLPGVPRSGKNPWGDYVGTWDLPNKLPGPRVYVPTARRFNAWDKLRREADDLHTTISGMTKNGRRNARLESVGFKITKPSKLGSMSPAHGDPCKDVISKVPKQPVEKFDLNAEVPEQPEVSAEKQDTLIPPPPKPEVDPGADKGKDLDLDRICGRTPLEECVIEPAKPVCTCDFDPCDPCGSPTKQKPKSPPKEKPKSPPKVMLSNECLTDSKKSSPAPPLPPFDDEGLTEEQKELVRRQCEPCPPCTNRQNVIPPCDTKEQANRRLCAAHMSIFHPPKCLSPQCRIPEADRTDAMTNMFSDDMCRRSPFPRRHEPMTRVCGAQAPGAGQVCQGFAPCLADLTEDICPIDPCPRIGLDSWCAYEETLKPTTPPAKVQTPPCKLPSPPTLSPRPGKTAVEREYEKVCRPSPPPMPDELCRTADGEPCRYPAKVFRVIPGADELAPCTRSDAHRTTESAVCPKRYADEDTAHFLTGPMILETPKQEKVPDGKCPAFL